MLHGPDSFFFIDFRHSIATFVYICLYIINERIRMGYNSSLQGILSSDDLFA